MSEKLKKLLKRMAQAVIEGDEKESVAAAKKAVAQGLDPLQAINEGLTAGMDAVGDQFSVGEAFLPDLIMAGEAMKSALAILEPELQATGRQRQVLGTVVLGTVKGDIHEIGKTLVVTMLAANGFRVYDLGVDVDHDEFVRQVQEHNADILGLSALLTTTMLYQREIINLLTEAGLRDRVKVMVGGCPVSQEWADKIGADGYAEDATTAVGVAKNLMGVS